MGPGNAPIYLHRTADVKGAVVDVLISKTFDASVICPAEQTCIIDEPIYDEVVAEFQRMGAHLLSDAEAEALAEFAFGCGDRVNLEALGQQAPELARRAGITVDPSVKVLLAPLPSDLDEFAAHPLVQEKLMPVLLTGRIGSSRRYVESRTGAFGVELHDGPARMTCDGEVRATAATMRFGVRPGALTVYTGPPGPGSGRRV